MAQNGGKRPGAGRPKGARDKLTREAGATLSELARGYTKQAIQTLVHVAVKGESEAARVSAANALLDRGYGKPPQSIDHGGALGTYALTPEQAREEAERRGLPPRIFDV